MDSRQSLAQLKAISHPDRLRLLDLLAHPELFPDNLVSATAVGVCVNDLARAAGLPQSTTSGHIGQLERCGVVEINQRGRWRYIRASRSALRELGRLVGQLGSRPLEP